MPSKILISTPLFPPEIAYPASFSKKLGSHLSKYGHDIVIATFSDSPEKIENVKVLHVRKSLNLIYRMIKFYFLLFMEIPKTDLIILKQAGFSSFLTLLVSKVFRKKMILILKEDEVEVRMHNLKIDKNSFTVWRVKKLQKFIFKHVDFILFENDLLKEKIIKEYYLHKKDIATLAHPKDIDIFPFGGVKENLIEISKNQWENYIENLLKIIKNYAK